MKTVYPGKKRWNVKAIACGTGVLALPVAGGVLHEVFDIGTVAHLAYYMVGICAALMCSLMAQSKPGWGKLLSAQIFVTLGFLPRVFLPIFSGVLDMTLAQALYLLVVPLIFVGVFLSVHWLFSRLEGPHAARFTAVMCLVAFGMHALLLPVLLGEPLRARILLVTEAEDEMIVATNPGGSLVLTHSALTPVSATLYAHRDGILTVLRRDDLQGYPVGLRVGEDHALIALRVVNNEKVVERIDFARLSASGLENVGSFPCTPDQNPSHLVNNLSPDGELFALADGTFVEVDTCNAVKRLPEGTNADGGLVFVEWTEPAGRAVFYHEKDRRLVLLYTKTQVADTYMLRGHPLSAQSVTVLPNGQHVWYEEAAPFNWQRAFVEDLEDKTRSKLSRRRGKGLEGHIRLWTGDSRLTYASELGALDSLNLDLDRKRFRQQRHTQLIDIATSAAVAREAGWLFWITQAAHGPGLAIHGERLDG